MSSGSLPVRPDAFKDEQREELRVTVTRDEVRCFPVIVLCLVCSSCGHGRGLHTDAQLISSLNVELEGSIQSLRHSLSPPAVASLRHCQLLNFHKAASIHSDVEQLFACLFGELVRCESLRERIR